MGIPFLQMATVGSYVARQELFGKKIAGKKRYPLVLMLEPLFRCNLACAGCGKIDYPDKILNERLPLADCPRGDRRVRRARRGRSPAASRCCTRSCRRSSRAPSPRRSASPSAPTRCCSRSTCRRYKPNKYFNWSIHLDGDKAMHDKSVCQKGVYDKALAALKTAKRRASASPSTAPCSTTPIPPARPPSSTRCEELGRRGRHRLAGLCLRARARPAALPQPHEDQGAVPQHLRARQRRQGAGRSIQSSLFLDFLAGNKTYQCTPWGNPTRRSSAGRSPATSSARATPRRFKELMETTAWDKYGTGNYEKCADCMVHCGFEATAVTDSFRRPWKLIGPALRGIRTKGKMAPDTLARQPAPGRVRLLTPCREADRRDRRQGRSARPAADGSGIGRQRRRARRGPS